MRAYAQAHHARAQAGAYAGAGARERACVWVRMGERVRGRQRACRGLRGRVRVGAGAGVRDGRGWTRERGRAADLSLFRHEGLPC